MAFVKFKDVGKSFTSRASISLNGTISFTDGARRKFSMAEYAYCVLYYDEEESRIGVELINDKSAEGAIKLRFRPTGADVGARSFLKCFDIALEVTTMFDIEAGEQGNWIVLNLKTGRKRKTKTND